MCVMQCGLTKEAEPPPTRDLNRDSGTDSANGGWLRRLVRHHIVSSFLTVIQPQPSGFPPSDSALAASESSNSVTV